jgi:hypothetical protein
MTRLVLHPSSKAARAAGPRRAHLCAALASAPRHSTCALHRSNPASPASPGRHSASPGRRNPASPGRHSEFRRDTP